MLILHLILRNQQFLLYLLTLTQSFFRRLSRCFNISLHPLFDRNHIRNRLQIIIHEFIQLPQIIILLSWFSQEHAVRCHLVRGHGLISRSPLYLFIDVFRRLIIFMDLIRCLGWVRFGPDAVVDVSGGVSVFELFVVCFVHFVWEWGFGVVVF